MQFITTGNRIAVENFVLGDLYTITFTNGTYINSACIGIGDNFVTFQRNEPELLFSLTMATAELVSSIDLYAGGSGTNNYNDLTNKPQINDVELVGNKSLSDLGIQPTISDIDTIRSGAAAGATAVQPAALADYQPIISDLDTIRSGAAAGATAVQPAALSDYQPIIDSSHKLDADLVDDTTATNKFATAAQLSQIETNKNNISKQQDTTEQGGNGYAIINGKRLYMTDTEPTNQRIGDVWIYDRLYTYTPILVNSPLYGTEAYKDSIDLSTGTITRKIRKLTLDSSINFGNPTAITGGYRYSVNNAMTDPALSDREKWECSHLTYRSDWGLLGFTVSNSANTLFIMINIDTTEGLKAWLDAQISANTPVILYYSSLTDTTETVTIPTGLTGTATGTMEQSSTPQPDNPIYPTGNNVTIWH